MEIYLAALEALSGDSDALEFGPAHIVWSDENWDCAEMCIRDFDSDSSGLGCDQLAIVMWSLKELADLPIEQREVEPADYDGEHPELYPPADGVEMMKQPNR